MAMRSPLWLLLVGSVFFTGCRRVPAPECKACCVSSEETCNNEGHRSWDRERACSKRFDECLAGCPRR